MAAQLPVIKDFVLVFTALFSIVNPIGSAFLFLEATRSRTPQQRNDLAKKVAVYAFFIMICSILIGIPIGILALFAYAALLLVGYVWLTVVVGGMLLDRIRPEAAARTAWRVGAAVLTMLVLGILVRVPFVGDTLRFLATGVGVGMVVAAMFRRPQPAEMQAAA